MVDGVPRVETHLEWQMTPHTDPSWNIQGCYITQVTGDPNIYSKHMIFPRKGFDLSNPENFASIGMTVTGLPALNSIRSVVGLPRGSSPVPTSRCGVSRDVSSCRTCSSGPRSRQAPRSMLTPVSSSATSHSLSATTMSFAFGDGSTSTGGPASPRLPTGP